MMWFKGYFLRDSLEKIRHFDVWKPMSSSIFPVWNSKVQNPKQFRLWGTPETSSKNSHRKQRKAVVQRPRKHGGRKLEPNKTSRFLQPHKIHGAVYLPTRYHKKQPNLGKYQIYHTWIMDPVGTVLLRCADQCPVNQIPVSVRLYV